MSTAFDTISRDLKAAAPAALRVYGVRRSGQHAVINWILRNCGHDNHVFLNNCRTGESPILSCAQFEIEGVRKRGAKVLAKTLAKRLEQGMRPFVLISYELGFPAQAYAENNIATGFENTDFDFEVLITRSFVNWLPSYMRLIRDKNNAVPEDGIDNLRHIMLGIQRYKAHLADAVTSGHIWVSYDDWFADPVYRLRKLGELKLVESDNSRGEIQKYGRGSSFSGTSIPAADLDIGARWKTLVGDPFAINILRQTREDRAFMKNLIKAHPEDAAIIEGLVKDE